MQKTLDSFQKSIEPDRPEPRPVRRARQKSWRWVWILILLAGLGVLAFFYLRERKQLADARAELSRASQANADEKAREEIQQIVGIINKAMVLPDGEEPTLATVTDPSKLEGQPFFVNARTGDKVLIYAAAKRAILYRPAEQKIIEVAPLSVGTPATGSKNPQAAD